jgi:multidrug efflux pump subunit AcrA (membrane-fusion protein)
MYATMRIRASVPASSLLVPDDALVFRDGKPYVPIVRGDKLKLVLVSLGQDNGNMVEVSGDVSGSDLVAVNVGQSAHDGEKVQPVMAEQ